VTVASRGDLARPGDRAEVLALIGPAGKPGGQ
jgi:hypothetical protein